MKKGLAFATLVAFVIVLGTMALVPSVRAQVGETLNTWFRFLTPGGGGEAAVFGPKTFTPLRPSYLPADFQSWMVKLSGKAGRESIELVYHFDEQFVAITQTKAAADRALPPGQEVTINGRPAVLVTGLQGTIDLGPRTPEGALKETVVAPPAVPTPYSAEIEPLTYTDGKQLTWYVGDVKVQMLSNLSVAEMLKIAESLVPAEAGEEKLPQPPPGNIPPLGSGGGVQKGPIQSQP